MCVLGKGGWNSTGIEILMIVMVQIVTALDFVEPAFPEVGERRDRDASFRSSSLSNPISSQITSNSLS